MIGDSLPRRLLNQEAERSHFPSSRSPGPILSHDEYSDYTNQHIYRLDLLMVTKWNLMFENHESRTLLCQE